MTEATTTLTRAGVVLEVFGRRQELVESVYEAEDRIMASELLNLSLMMTVLAPSGRKEWVALH